MRCVKLETLCDTIQYSLAEDDKIDTQFHSVPKEKMGSCFLFLCLFESDVEYEVRVKKPQ